MLKHMLFGGVVEPAKPWVATLGGTDIDRGRSVAIGPDGSVYVCGETKSAGAGSSDLLIAKFNSSGTLQWQKTLGGSGDDYGRSVAVGPDGSVYVCGYTASADVGGEDLLLAKFSSSGAMQWQKTFSGIHADYGYSVAVASDGSIYVCGETYSFGHGYYSDLFLAKFNSSGTMQWQKILDYVSHDVGHSVTVASDGSIYVCGETGDGNDRTDLFLIKFNSSGAIQWQKILGSYDGDIGQSIAIAPDGSVYVCGCNVFDIDDMYLDHLLLIKFNSSGTVQWQKTLVGSAIESGYSVAIAPDGSVYVCGETWSAGIYGSLLLAKFSSSGTMQWQKILNGNNYALGQSVAVAPDGSVYVCGYTTLASVGSEDLLLAKITDSLTEKDIATFGSFTFQDASLTLNNTSLTSKTDSLSVSDTSLTMTTSSLTVGTPSLTTNLYTYKE